MRQPQIILLEKDLAGSDYRLNNILKLLILVILFVGLFSVEHCFMQGTVSIILMVLTLVPISLAIFSRKVEKWNVIRYVILIIAVLIAMTPPISFISGFLNFVNQCIELWNAQFSGSVSSYAVGNLTDLAIYRFWAVANLLIALGFSYFIKKNRIEFIGLIILAIMLSATYFHLNVPVFSYAIFIVGLIICFTGENLFQQSLKKVIPFLVVTATIATVIFIITASFGGSQSVYNFKERAKDGVDNLRYGSDTLPQGELVKAAEMVGDKEKITLTIEGKMEEELYLRGFVGSTFNNSKWEPLDGKNYTGEMNGLLDWLAGKNFSSQYQYAQYNFVAKLDAEPTGITVKNIGAYRKYLYLPYEAIELTGGSGKTNRDWQIISKGVFGENEYSFSMTDKTEIVDNIIYKQIDTTTAEGQNYQDAQAVYEDFVKKKYIEVNKEEKSIIEDKVFDGKDWSKGKISQITSKIRLSMQTNGNTISKKPTVYDGQEDFVKWFTDGNKKCNSAYYATMGVLAYRTVGIPARYVEGYYLAANAVINNKSVNASEADAHGWVEIYVDEIGWLPVEVTPGLYSTEYTAAGVAPSPNSTVNIVENNDDTISGKTSDTLKNKKKDAHSDDTPLQRVFHILGTGLLTILILVLIRAISELQAFFRKQSFMKNIQSENDREVACRAIFDRVCKIFTVFNVANDFRFPQECLDKLAETFPNIREDEYERFLELVEKSIFDNGNIDEMEYRTVSHFLAKLTENAYEQGTFWEKARLKYIYAI